MSHPIPLRADDDHLVYAYLCSTCRHVYTGGDVGVELTEPNEHISSLAYDMAEHCCRCDACGAPCTEWTEDGRICSSCLPAKQAEHERVMEQSRQEREVRDAAVQASVAQALDRDAAFRLFGLMSEISEDTFCAGWCSSIETDLWGMTFGGELHGFYFCVDTAELRWLSEKAGGWWYYDETVHDTVFITTSAWLERINRTSGMG